MNTKVLGTEEKTNAIDGKTYDPRKEPRYSDIATFMRAPLADSLDDLDIALIGVPTDLGVTNRAGARPGPREIRNASSLMRLINLATQVRPFELCRIADVGDVRFSQEEEEVEGSGVLFTLTTTARFSEVGDYVVRLQAVDWDLGNAFGFHCCWTNSYLNVSVTR